MGGQEKSQHHKGLETRGSLRRDSFRSTAEVSNTQPYPGERTADVDKNLEYL
jgi:hypothetical protein